ncbi:MAG TPA: right-handed parallel beta-helix repeat-containing protein [Lysobacter sp.]
MQAIRSWCSGLAVLATLFAASAHAAESYDNCIGYVDALPATISTQGVWCLRADQSTAISTGYAIELAANNVTLDCNGYKLGGLAAGAGTNASGIYAASGRLNATVRNCSVRGFRFGIQLLGDGHRIEANRIDGNTEFGIVTVGDGNQVLDNLVYGTGGRPGEASAYAIWATGQGVRVLGNDIDGVDPGGVDGAKVSYGIYAQNSLVAGNRITGLVAAGAGAARGIILYGRSVTRGNLLVQFDPVAGTTGIWGNAASACHGDSIKGYETAFTLCESAGMVTQP